MNKLTAWFMSRNERERTILIAGAAVIVLVLIWAALAPLYKSVSAREERVARKQADLAWLQGAQGELMSLNVQSPGGAAMTGESLVVLIDRTAREAGLGGSLVSQTPNGANGMNIRLDSAPFDSVVSWLGTLQQRYSVSIDTVTIDHTSKPGLVNASLVLMRAAGA
jgi:general secretion pathway protein M